MGTLALTLIMIYGITVILSLFLLNKSPIQEIIQITAEIKEKEGAIDEDAVPGGVKSASWIFTLLTFIPIIGLLVALSAYINGEETLQELKIKKALMGKVSKLNRVLSGEENYPSEDSNTDEEDSIVDAINSYLFEAAIAVLDLISEEEEHHIQQVLIEGEHRGYCLRKPGEEEVILNLDTERIYPEGENPKYEVTGTGKFKE